MLEEYYFQHYFNGWNEGDPHIKKFLESIFSVHKAKQRWFGRMANDFLNDHAHLKPASMLIRSMMEGVAEDAKQNSTYVGLTKKGKRVDLNGKMIIPRLFAQPEKAKKTDYTKQRLLVSVYKWFLKRGVRYGFILYCYKSRKRLSGFVSERMGFQGALGYKNIEGS